MKALPFQGAYWEAIHQPVNKNMQWAQTKLLNAARAAKCQNTGSPIGVVLDTPNHGPQPKADGIEARIRSGGFYDYWALNTQGAFYFLRRLEEDARDVLPKNAVFFDTRIWRVAEVFLHCSNLYRELGLPAKTEIEIEISHHGLDGKTLAASRWDRRMTMNDRRCSESSSSWRRAVVLDSIEPHIEEHVKAVLAPFFMLFDFWEPADSVWTSVVDEFLASRVF